MTSKNCSICQKEFTCGTTQTGESCWCTNYPTIMPVGLEQDCRCPTCLARVIGKRIEEQIHSKNHEEMIVLAEQYKNNHPPIEHIDYTIEDGLQVFSHWHHLKRGSCCGNDCRHCPYPD